MKHKSSPLIQVSNRARDFYKMKDAQFVRKT